MMKFFKTHRKWIAVLVVFTFLYLVEISAFPLNATDSRPANENEISKSSDTPSLVERTGSGPTYAKKKHFPWLWVILGLVLVAGGVYYYLNYVQKFTMTVTKGEGVDGTPEGGSTKYKRTETVSWNYTLKTGYKNLQVTLDGTLTGASGSVSMKKNHTLAATATQQFTLTVSIDAGVDGTPATGTYTYEKGQTASYSYTLKTGFSNLEVKLDGVAAPAAGTITMNGDHALTATTIGQRKLTVNRGAGVSGTPSTGTYSYTHGATVNYSYSALFGYKHFVVILDGVPVAPIGSVVMDADHTLNSGADNGLELLWYFTGTAQDSSAHERHGTVYGAALTTDRHGTASRAYYFDGVNDYIQGPNFHAHESNNITLSFWVKIPGSTGIQYFIWHNDLSVAQNGTDISFVITTTVVNNAKCAIPLNTWTHIAGTFDGTNIRIYRNGILMATTANPGNLYVKNYNFEIGRHLTFSYWKGYVDDVRIYSYCMSQSDIAYLAGL